MLKTVYNSRGWLFLPFLVLIVGLFTCVVYFVSDSDARIEGILHELCDAESVHGYHSVMLGETPAKVWRCEGKLISEKFARILAKERRAGESKYWVALKNTQ